MRVDNKIVYEYYFVSLELGLVNYKWKLLVIWISVVANNCQLRNAAQTTLLRTGCWLRFSFSIVC